MICYCTYKRETRTKAALSQSMLDHIKKLESRTRVPSIAPFSFGSVVTAATAALLSRRVSALRQFPPSVARVDEIFLADVLN